MQLSIIIVSYNVKYFAEQCLYSVLNAVKNIEAQIIVVDNNSTDGTKEYLTGRFKNVQFIWNTENVGFSKANNMGILHATGDYMLFLNPDTIVDENCFQKCLTFLKNTPGAGALGVRMVDGQGNFLKESKRGFPSLQTAFYKLSGLAALFPSSFIFARYYAGNLSQYTTSQVAILAGAFMMTGKKIIQQVGGFDESFFMYGEDIDLSCRIQLAGYQNYYFADSTIIHFKGESTQKQTLENIQVFYGAMQVFVSKHYKGFKAFVYNTFIQMAMVIKTSSFRVANLISKDTTTTSVNPQPWLVIANPHHIQELNAILKNAGVNLVIAQVIEPESIAKSDDAAILQSLQPYLTKYNPSQILFCIDGLTAANAIKIIQCLGKRFSYKFHFATAGSIVGSSSKNKNGDAIA